MFTRLLVPLDGTSMAETVLPVVERLATAFSSNVVLLHVIERAARPLIHGERHFTDETTAAAYLREIAAALQSRQVRVTVHAHGLPEGNVAASIALHGAEEGTDLIVLCAHGGRGIRGFLSGSIGQQVLRRGLAPVLLVPSPGAGTPAAAFRPDTILLPLDGTPAAEAALVPAAALATKLGSRLRLAMVVATANTVRDNRMATTTLLPSATRLLLDLEEAQAEEYLTRLAEPLHAAGIVVETEVRRGDTVTELASETAEHPIGLAVVATHGRAGLPALWAGSVGARLLANAHVPVLLLRSPAPRQTDATPS